MSSDMIAVNIKKEAGPISMTFTIPMFNASRLQVSFCIQTNVPQYCKKFVVCKWGRSLAEHDIRKLNFVGDV